MLCRERTVHFKPTSQFSGVFLKRMTPFSLSILKTMHSTAVCVAPLSELLYSPSSGVSYSASTKGRHCCFDSRMICTILLRGHTTGRDSFLKKQFCPLKNHSNFSISWSWEQFSLTPNVGRELTTAVPIPQTTHLVSDQSFNEITRWEVSKCVLVLGGGGQGFYL